LTDVPLWNSVYDRFLWQEVFPYGIGKLKAIMVVRDPIRCFYSLYNYVKEENVRNVNLCGLRTCIRHAVSRYYEYKGDRKRIDEENFRTAEAPISQCSILHNLCAAASNIRQGCDVSPGMCNADRLKVVRVEECFGDRLNRLAQWLGVTGKLVSLPGIFKMNARKNEVVNATEEDGMLAASYADEYEVLPMWLDQFGA